MSQNINNPLIDGLEADTIQNIQDMIDWLIVSAEPGETVHAGQIMALRCIKSAVSTLKTQNV